MMKKESFFAVIAFITAGFQLIVLQYKVTQVAMKVPSLEEKSCFLMEETQNLELKLHSLKNPAHLMAQATQRLSFPRQPDIFAVHMEPSKAKEAPIQTAKPSLPIAKAFP